MPFYQDSVFGPSEHSQLQHAASAHPPSTPPRRRPSRTMEVEGSPNINDGSAKRPFRMPREVMSPAPLSPIPISPTYHSYREDDDDDVDGGVVSEVEDAKAVGGRAGVSEEEDAVADELVLDEGVDAIDGFNNERRGGARRGEKASQSEKARQKEKTHVTAIRRHGQQRQQQQPSERYLSLPRDAAKHRTFKEISEDDEEYDNADVERSGPRGGNGRRHNGLVSSRPRTSPQKRPNNFAPTAPPYTPKSRHQSTRHRAMNDEVDDSSNSASDASPSEEEGIERPAFSSRQRATQNRTSHRRRDLTPPSPSDSSSDAYVHPPSHPPPRKTNKKPHNQHAGEEEDDDYNGVDSNDNCRNKGVRQSVGKARPPPSAAHQERRARSPSSQPPPPPSPPLAHCDRCGYALPEEMNAYLRETSGYGSVPRPHCPACGCRLKLPLLQQQQQQHPSGRRGVAGSRRRNGSDSSEEVDEEESDEGRRNAAARRTPQRVAPPPARRSPARNYDEEVNLYSDPEASADRGEDRDGNGGPARRSRADLRYPPPPQQPPQVPPSANPASPHHAPVLIPKSPYLTLEFMPRNLAATMKARTAKDSRHGGRRSSSSNNKHYAENDEVDNNSDDDDDAAYYQSAVNRRRRSMDLDHAGVPWATPCCEACGLQCSVGLAGILCCCAMPCVLFRERQQLLFHEVESRYICCAGAFPCCVPPASLRPELYYTVKTEYLDAAQPPIPSQQQRTLQDNADRPRYWGNAVEVSRESDSVDSSGEINAAAAAAARERRRSSTSLTAARAALPVGPNRAALRSATGIASPSSLVNPRTGLPLEGCYHNTASHRHHRPGGTRAGDDDDGGSSSSGNGCCDCVTCVDNTCVWDCSRGCCLPCRHPTAHCLACPLCCLCCELTFCMPCALWANRLLIRQHYNLAPDPTIDDGAACCYSCCLHCCTCQAISVVSQHHSTAAQASQQQRQQQQQYDHHRVSHVKAAGAAGTLSCWSQLATTVAACLAAVCCLCPCASCSLAQQRDQMERLGYPLVVEVPPEMEMM